MALGVANFSLRFLVLAAAGVLSMLPGLGRADDIPATMRQCEQQLCDRGGGGTWTFNGRTGKARWTVGVQADLTVERYENGEVIIRRVDVADGPTRGATAIYRGTIRGNHVEGTVDYNWPGHFDHGKMTTTWFAIIGAWTPGLEPTPRDGKPNASAATSPAPQMVAKAQAPLAIQPARISECETKGCGGDWRFTGRTGTAHWPNGVEAQLTIERFDADQVIIHRKDTGSVSLGLTAVYAGKLTERRIDGEVTYTWPGHLPAPAVDLWHATIETSGSGDTETSVPRPNARSAAAAGIDLNGSWRPRAKPGAPQNGPPLEIAIVQQGTQVTAFHIKPRAPFVVFRGAVEGTQRMVGHYCAGARHADNPNCLLESDTIAVLDATHLKDKFGVEFERIAGSDDSRWQDALGRADAVNARAFLRDAPFDLTGEWQPDERKEGSGTFTFTQAQGVVTATLAAAQGAVMFKGNYERNPAFNGTGKSTRSLSVDVPWSIFIDDPDHLRINAEGKTHPLHRVSTPRIDDPPCDAQNRHHVDPHHAWLRGQAASERHDNAAAACWLSVSANQNWPAGQSSYAALLANGPPAGHELAFEMATRSAQQGHLNGQLLLADLIREGKGTIADPAKADYWLQQAERTRLAQAQQQGRLALEAAIGSFYKVLADGLVEIIQEQIEYERTHPKPNRCHRSPAAVWVDC